MILLLFSAVLLIISTQLFAFSYSIRGLNNAIINMPIAILFKDTVVGVDGAKIIKENAIDHLENYYNKYLPKYCKSFETDYYFYNPSDDSLCLDDLCVAVEININATLNLNYTYHRTMYYELMKGVYNG